jgi:NTP pyrophosphatase (non-canonical NTP hydrolase)
MKEEPRYRKYFTEPGPGAGDARVPYVLPLIERAGDFTIPEWMDVIKGVNEKKGWYEKPVPLVEAMFLVVTELAELYEAERNGKLDSPCDKAEKMMEMGLPPLTCKEEEFADVFIRLMHYADLFGVKNLAGAVQAKLVYNALGRKYRNGGKTA